MRIHMKGREPIKEKDILIGRMSIMLINKKCNLSGKTKAEIFQYGEFPYEDIRDILQLKAMNQKVILIQEQIVDNRIIDGIDNKTDQYVTTVQSYHIETKSKVSIIKKKNKFYVKTSSFKDALHFIELIGTELRNYS